MHIYYSLRVYITLVKGPTDGGPIEMFKCF